MSDALTIQVYEVVGSTLCVASDDGQKVHDRIAAALRENRNVALSFRNVESLTSAFLNAAVGQLYASFTEDQVRARVRVEDMEQDDLVLLKRVVDTAKQYFKDPERFKDAAREVLGDDDE
ncbi:MAG: STAS-like domain-containing protein [Phycisphaerae bacterium]